MRAMSLAADEGEGEQMELRTLQEQLVLTQTLVINLSQQLNELKDQVKISATTPKKELIPKSLLTFVSDDRAAEAKAAHRASQPQLVQHAQRRLRIDQPRAHRTKSSSTRYVREMIPNSLST
jgi:hypothetical protein